MFKINRLISWLAPLLLVGCATQNVPGLSSYVAVPSSQFLSEIPPIGNFAENAIIIVKRDPGFLGSALSSVFTIDGKPIASIKPGQYIELSLHPKEYVFGVAWSDGLGALETSTTREIAIDSKPRKTYYLRLFPQIANGIGIERTSQ